MYSIKLHHGEPGRVSVLVELKLEYQDRPHDVITSPPRPNSALTSPYLYYLSKHTTNTSQYTIQNT